MLVRLILSFFRSLLKLCLFWCNLCRFCYQDSRLARHVFGDKKPLGSDWDWWTGSVSKQMASKRWEDERGWTKRKMGGQHPKYILDYTCMDAKRAVWNDCWIITYSILVIFSCCFCYLFIFLVIFSLLILFRSISSFFVLHLPGEGLSL